ncbi:hypothetical protein [Streptomyces sp. NBC_01198]|uniref:hypothetical protein n=1 Tax=Streptomyces sp. NBC_01198 TaxID=2903769 RepID=UPI002E0E158C|nr:hypothetical protein OG702_07770 [Streptomyces sp. NBC_01198]
MTADFTYYFRSLVAALGDRPGWYGLYAQREPAAARDHESGRETPPWDVVRTVLRDLAVNSGAEDIDPGEAGRVFALHRAALAAEDAAPDADARLRIRLAAAAQARESAVVRAREAARAYARQPTAARGQALAWTRDELTRTTSRCTDLHQRLAAVAPADPAPGDPAPAEPEPPARRPRGARFARAYDQPAGSPLRRATAPAAPDAPAARAPRGARFAGSYEQPAAPPAPEPVRAAAPRGARFAGAPQQDAAPVRPAADPRWAAEARDEAARLGRLRQAGESGAAYLVLCAAAEGPPDRLPYVVRELERTGLAADVATLLWEIAALPPQPVAEAVSALAADGRGMHSRTLLHQVAARPAGDVAVVADLLHGGGRSAEAGELLETVARGRTADAAAAVARARPALTDPLLAAAARVSPPCHRDLAAALHRGTAW